jgi:hypothetical protein
MISPRPHSPLPQHFGNPVTRVLRSGVDDPANGRPTGGVVSRVDGRGTTLKRQDEGGEVVEPGGVGFEGGGAVADLGVGRGRLAGVAMENEMEVSVGEEK